MKFRIILSVIAPEFTWTYLLIDPGCTYSKYMQKRSSICNGICYGNQLIKHNDNITKYAVFVIVIEMHIVFAKRMGESANQNICLQFHTHSTVQYFDGSTL